MLSAKQHFFGKEDYHIKKLEALGLWPLEDNPDDEARTRNFKKYLIHPRNIPECDRCVDDTKRYRSLATDHERKAFKPDCCRWCIWYQYFDKIRRG